MKNFLFCCLAIGQMTAATVTLPVDELLKKSTYTFSLPKNLPTLSPSKNRSIDVAGNQTITSDLSNVVEGTIQPIFERNGQQVTFRLEDFSIVSRHIADFKMKSTIKGQIFSGHGYIEHHHPLLAKNKLEDPVSKKGEFDTLIHMHLSPIVIEAKTGTQKINRHMIKQILASFLESNNISKELATWDVKEWSVDEKGNIAKAKFYIEIDPKFFPEYASFVSKIRLDLLVSGANLLMEARLKFANDGYLQLIEPEMDKIITYALMIQNLDPEAINFIEIIAEAFSNTFKKLESQSKN